MMRMSSVGKIAQAIFPYLLPILLHPSWSLSSGLAVHDETFIPNVTLHITLQTIQLNCQPRSSLLVNATYPGPTIYLTPEETTWIRVYNDADVNFTMHWHGLSQSTVPFSDGSPQASQWPIPPYHFFDYQLRPRAHEAGTYFYHSHVGFQAITAHGPLIVKDIDGPPYQYDEEIILITGDVYEANDAQIEAGLAASPPIGTGEPTAFMINGMSGTAPTMSMPARDPSCRPYLINVLPDTTYRIRVIGATAESLLSIAFEDHCNLTIIETDGSYVHPVVTNHIQVDTGQRFSLLFRTKTAAELQSLANRAQFWMQIVDPEGPSNATSWAVLNYQFPKNSKNTFSTVLHLPKAPFLPVPTPSQLTSWLEYTFRNLAIPGYGTPPTLIDVTRRITITSLQLVNASTDQQVQDLNNVTWSADPPLGPSVQVPYLVNIYLHGEAAIPNYTAALQYGGWDPRMNAWPALMGEVLEIVWLNAADAQTGIWEIHPMHAHGGQYWDIGSGSGTYDPIANEARMQATGYAGSRRDTTMLYRYGDVGRPGEVDGWRAWRLRVDNPGVWMMHCHILQHIVMGMSTAWVFGDAAEIVMDRLDLTGYLTYGGNAYGSQATAPAVLE